MTPLTPSLVSFLLTPLTLSFEGDSSDRERPPFCDFDEEEGRCGGEEDEEGHCWFLQKDEEDEEESIERTPFAPLKVVDGEEETCSVFSCWVVAG